MSLRFWNKKGFAFNLNRLFLYVTMSVDWRHGSRATLSLSFFCIQAHFNVLWSRKKNSVIFWVLGLLMLRLSLYPFSSSSIWALLSRSWERKGSRRGHPGSLCLYQPKAMPGTISNTTEVNLSLLTRIEHFYLIFLWSFTVRAVSCKNNTTLVITTIIVL